MVQEAAAAAEAPKAADKGTENPVHVAAETAATERIMDQVTDERERQFQQCVMKKAEPLDVGPLTANTFSLAANRIGGDNECGAIDRLRDLRRPLTASGEHERVESRRVNGTDIETKTENGRITAIRTVDGDTTTLRTFDRNGNLDLTISETGEGPNRVQTWTFPGRPGDVLRIKADSSYEGVINGRKVSGAGRAEVQALIDKTLDENSEINPNDSTLGTDLEGGAFMSLAQTGTGAFVLRDGRLQIFDKMDSGPARRSVASFEGDTMVLRDTSGNVIDRFTSVAPGPDGMFSYTHNGITYKWSAGGLQEILSQRGDVAQRIHRDQHGWRSTAIQQIPDAPANEVSSYTTGERRGETQVRIGDRIVNVTHVTPDAQITYRDGVIDPSHIEMNRDRNKLETPEITRNGNSSFDSSGAITDKDGTIHQGVFYDVVAGKLTTKQAMTTFAGAVQGMAEKVISSVGYFAGVQIGEDFKLAEIGSRLDSIRALIGFVNCNVNGSRFLGLLPMANLALQTGMAAQCEAGTVLPTKISEFSNPELAQVKPEDVKTPDLTVVNGRQHYLNELAFHDSDGRIIPFKPPRSTG